MSVAIAFFSPQTYSVSFIYSLKLWEKKKKKYILVFPWIILFRPLFTGQHALLFFFGIFRFFNWICHLKKKTLVAIHIKLICKSERERFRGKKLMNKISVLYRYTQNYYHILTICDSSPPTSHSISLWSFIRFWVIASLLSFAGFFWVF